MGRRSANEGSIYKRKRDGLWTAQYLVDTPEGKTKRKYIYGKKRKDVAEKPARMGGGAYLMAVCSGNKRNGSRCTATVEPPQRYCWWHDPANAQTRRRAASKGGRGKVNRELATIKEQLQTLAHDVLEGHTAKGDAAVVAQIYNVLLRALETERKWKELTELEERLEVLEQAEGVRGWGA